MFYNNDTQIKNNFMSKNKLWESLFLNFLDLLVRIYLHSIYKATLENTEQWSACLLLKRYSQFLLW